jgi:flagellar hook-length control protein FliK
LRISPSPEPRLAPAQQLHEAGESVQGDRARFVQRVARAFQAVGKSSGSIRLRLSPPELGSLRLEITVRQGLMNARVEAETPTARNLLLDNLPALRERLAQQEIKVKQFDVALMDRSPGGLPEQTADHTQPHQRHGSDTAAQFSSDAIPTSGSRTVNRPGEGTQLNVVV